jgi:hypothetical protein
MANTRTLQFSFAGGEVSPEMFGRIDDAKYRSGLAACRNFIPKLQGPVENRPGFRFVREVKDSTKAVRLISFTYSTTQTMVLEMGAGYFRFHTQGATLMDGSVPYEIANPYAEADLFDIHYVQSADVLTLVHPNYAPRELRRLGATNWQLSTIAFAPAVSPPSVKVKGNAKGTNYFYQYVVTSVSADGLQESVASEPAQGSAKVVTAVTQANPGVITTSVAHGLAVGNSVYASDFGGMTQLNDNYYVVNTVPTTTTLTLEDSAGNVIDTTTFTAFTSGGNIYQAGVKNNLFATGGANTITWEPVVGAAIYNVYKFQGGIYGYIGQTAGSSLVDDNISPDLSKTPPLYETVFDAAGKYPGAVSYFEQRRSFAGTDNQPQNVWMTRSGTESTMSYSLPIRDDDRISFRVAAREANTIRHIVPLSQLLLLTSSAEWRVASVNSDAVTPTTIAVRPQSYVGASNVQPVIINNSLLYGAARGGHVRELGYNWQANGYITGDLSLRAPHLFDSYDIVDMAYAKAPQPLVWFVSTSGKLLGLTYVPEQQVGAWHQHDTDGTFESCATVAEGSEDRLYVVVQRTIDGQAKRYIEHMASRQFVDQADAFFVDCGLSYDGAPATVFSGLDHLEGKTVSILADGAVHPQRVVTSGSLTLDQEASVVQIGLPITADLQTLPWAAQIDGGFGQGRYKNVNKAWLRVYRSSGIFIGPEFDQLVEAKQRTTEAYGAATALKSAEIPLMLTPSWADSGQVCVRQSDPLPLTVVSLTTEVALGG